ncbi:hypothetical protein BJ138DRAFT_756547 [Hygrophoropsis aurantiaca]|uniref:Uncharacterized protein n=1 Tax=Hygrophoropsis aurantiaca TaxID=72124 RepID=A0ACB8AGF5_9AGAM|nr:hypothetical protein BJ138DRAFT_756547 [Hygrophoropsis aurantiaca]
MDFIGSTSVVVCNHLLLGPVMHTCFRTDSFRFRMSDQENRRVHCMVWLILALFLMSGAIWAPGRDENEINVGRYVSELYLVCCQPRRGESCYV